MKRRTVLAQTEFLPGFAEQLQKSSTRSATETPSPPEANAALASVAGEGARNHVEPSAAPSAGVAVHPNTPSAFSGALSLERPIVSFDVETTGLDVKNDRIIEISCVKLHPGGRREIRTFRINPERPISQEAAAVHGITDEDVADCPVFAVLAQDIYQFLQGCDLTGFNLEGFDIPMLKNEFSRCGMAFPEEGARIIDCWRIFLAKEPRDLSAAYRFYCGKTLVDAHSAEADAVAAADILLAQVSRYDDLPADVKGLHAFCHPHHPDWIDPDGKIVWRNGEAVLTFGKHRNTPLQTLVEQESAYLKWVLNANFSDAVIQIIRDALNGKLPEPPAEVVNA